MIKELDYDINSKSEIDIASKISHLAKQKGESAHNECHSCPNRPIYTKGPISIVPEMDIDEHIIVTELDGTSPKHSFNQ